MTSPVAAVTPAGVDVVFSDLPHVHGLARQHFLRVGLASQFLATAKEMNGRGWILKLEDCCRTPKMQTLGLHEHMFSAILREMQWELGGLLHVTGHSVGPILVERPRSKRRPWCGRVTTSMRRKGNRASGTLALKPEWPMAIRFLRMNQAPLLFERSRHRYAMPRVTKRSNADDE